MSLPLIIDTDVALGVIWQDRPRDIDDGFAMVEAINMDSIDLRAVTTVFGNGPLDRVDAIARDIVARKSADVPVATGAATPLPAAGPIGPSNDAVELLAATLAAGPCHVAAIGPLTNMGLLAEHHPEALGNALSVVIVGGRSRDRRFYIGDVGPVGDFNVENDIRAAELLMAAGVPVTMAGFELTSQVELTSADLERIRDHGTDLAAHIYGESLPWLDFVLDRFPGSRGFHPWDSAAVQWLVHPERFAAEQRGWRIRPSPDEPDKAWLETDADFDHANVTFLTGFNPGGGQAFIEDIVASVH